MKKNTHFLGVDVGSVSTNIVLTNKKGEIIDKVYLRTCGQPINALKKGLLKLKGRVGSSVEIAGVGTTGSGRQLAGVIVGADIIKNEITTHAVAAQKEIGDVRTILEIGGQDSKIIVLRNGIVYDFAMNTVCAAGTGSFLDRQAERLAIPIEEFGAYALRSKSTVRIAGRCAVFAESDMIHKQQTGHNLEDIINGLCEALVRNYLSNLGKGKEIREPVVFQGGVAANIGIIEAFKKALGKSLIIPEHYDVMGAIGAALLAKDKFLSTGLRTKFSGLEAIENKYEAKSWECQGCSNMCEIIEILSNGKIIARWGDRCGKWSNTVNMSQGAG